jgi:hypothetical protein
VEVPVGKTSNIMMADSSHGSKAVAVNMTVQENVIRSAKQDDIYGASHNPVVRSFFIL